MATVEARSVITKSSLVTDANLTALTDGSETALHSHAGGGGGGSGSILVDRGDPAAYDWTETGSKAVLNTDGTWRDLDCSGIVPANAIAICFRLVVYDNADNKFFILRKNGNSNDKNCSGARSITNKYIEASFTVFCDANRVVEYSASNTAFSNLRLVITGWFIPA